MTAPEIPAPIVDQIHDHVRSTTDREVGGVLVGTLADDGDGTTRIVAAIPALKAVGAATNVTFTHDVWDEALAIVDRDHPGQRIVGWYHSHPDFGVFLSEYDLFIHRNFFPLPGMMALVVDPLRGEAGWFTTVDDDIRQIAGYQLAPVARASETAALQRETRSRARSAVLYGCVAAIAAFALGWALSPKPASERAGDERAIAAERDRADAAEERARALEAELEQERSQRDTSTTVEDGAPPTTVEGDDTPRPAEMQAVYTVQPGDSLWRIAERFYGRGSRWEELSAANGNLTTLDPGTVLVIPGLLSEEGPLRVRPHDG